MSRFVCITAALLCAATATQGEAATFRKTTQQGRPVTIATHASWDTGCAGGPSPIAIVSPPQHGALSIAPMNVKIERIDIGEAHCLGRPITANAVIYTPAPGFRGTDQLSYTATSMSGKVAMHQATVDVR
jgi:hypothetical protein